MKSRVKISLWRLIKITITLIIVFSFGESGRANNLSITSLYQNTNTYLPLTVNNFPWPTTFGAQIGNLANTGVKDLAKDSGIYWARIDAFDWSKIEPQNTTPATYKWNVVDEESFIAAYEIGINVIAIIRNTPSWAQKIPPHVCGPISQSALPDFVNYVKDLVNRYGAPPYNIKYWELGNEPDVDPALVSPKSVYGCWGDKDETYYGGEYYAEMLEVVYPAIKAADPEAKVLIGGLLLDCDPTNPPEGKDCKSGKFLEGILRNGGGEYFDIVSFHGYPPYAGSLTGNGGLYYDEQFPSWAHRGGVVLGKVDFLRQVMDDYTVDKPIIHTEGSLICPEYNSTYCDPPGEDFFETQADYVVWFYIRNWANGLLGSIWYQFEGPGWRYGGLLDENQVPKPAYHALEYLNQELGKATYIGRVEVDPNIAGYEFTTNQKKIWVLWSPDEDPHSITLPNTALKVLDKYGYEIVLSSNQIEVNKPIYVEFNK